MWEIKFNKSVPAALESYLKEMNFENKIKECLGKEFTNWGFTLNIDCLTKNSSDSDHKQCGFAANDP